MKKENKKIIIFDVDGTLANYEHRIELWRTNQWQKAEEMSAYDPPHKEVLYLYNLLANEPDVITIICTARKEETRERTEKWLADIGVQHHEAMFRRNNDPRPDDLVKKDMLYQIVEKYGIKPYLVFEDRKSVCKMWRDNGVMCLQMDEIE